MAFNRDRNSRGGDRGGFRPRPSFGGRQDGRPRFNDRGSNRGPAEMHKAICDNCRRECEVPFRPTSGKPVYCSNCFENKRAPERSEDSPRFAGEAGRQMFDAVCADCGNTCSVPFRPSGLKAVFCSNCFGGKKHDGENSGGGRDEFKELNAKLDKILGLLSPAEKPIKVAKKKASVKKSPAVEN